MSLWANVASSSMARARVSQPLDSSENITFNAGVLTLDANPAHFIECTRYSWGSRDITSLPGLTPKRDGPAQTGPSGGWTCRGCLSGLRASPRPTQIVCARWGGRKARSRRHSGIHHRPRLRRPRHQALFRRRPGRPASRVNLLLTIIGAKCRCS